LKKVRAENPNLTEDDLKIKFAEVTNIPSNRDLGVHRLPNPNFPHPEIRAQHAIQQAALHQQRQRNLQNQHAIMQHMAVHQDLAQNFARRVNAVYVPGPDDREAAILRTVNQRRIMGMDGEGQGWGEIQPGILPAQRHPDAFPTFQDYLAHIGAGRPGMDAVLVNPPPLPRQPQVAERVRRRFEFG